MACLIVLGGYLGAGKTTLLNRLLADNHGLQIAVVVNDFGAIDIDTALITRQDDDVMEFANGCMCCQLRDEATPLMRELAARPDLDIILVELSGVALPSSFTSWGNVPGLQPGPAVVLADAKAVKRQLRDEFIGDVVVAQIEQADVLVISKHEYLPEAQVNEVRSSLARVAPAARILLLPTGQPVPIDQLIAVQPYVTATSNAQDFDDTLEHTDERFVSFVVSGQTVSDVEQLATILKSAAELFQRAKGVVRTRSGSQFVVQMAGGSLSVEPTAQPVVSSELVFIAVLDPTRRKQVDAVVQQVQELFLD